MKTAASLALAKGIAITNVTTTAPAHKHVLKRFAGDASVGAAWAAPLFSENQQGKNKDIRKKPNVNHQQTERQAPKD